MDIVKKEEKSLDEHIFNTKMNLYLNNAGKNHSFLNLIKNDKYLFINFQKEDYYFMGPNILYNNQINNYKNPFVGYILDLKKKYLENKYELFKDKKLKILCNYNNDLFLCRINNFHPYYHNNSISLKTELKENLRLFKYEDNIFKPCGHLPIKINEDEQILKLSNNSFIIYSLEEIKLFKFY